MKNLERLKNLLVAKSTPRPTVAFEREVGARARRYQELRKLVAEVLYLEAQQATAVIERRAEMARLHHESLVAARRGDRQHAVGLTRAVEDARAAIAEADAELQDLRQASADAKALLREAGTTLAELSREARAVERTERLHRVGARMRALGAAKTADLDAARFELERLRAERTLEAELRALPAGL